MCLEPDSLSSALACPLDLGATRGEAKDSALLSSRDAGLLEPHERPQGSPASSSVSYILLLPRRER